MPAAIASDTPLVTSRCMRCCCTSGNIVWQTGEYQKVLLTFMIMTWVFAKTALDSTTCLQTCLVPTALLTCQVFTRSY